MTRVKLREKVTKSESVEKTVKSDLWASKCSNCGEVFKMGSGGWCDGTPRTGEVRGIFDVCPGELGNMFSCDVCSFECAHAIYTGGWRNIEEYKPYVDADAKLSRGELRISDDVKFEKELIDEWDSADVYPDLVMVGVLDQPRYEPVAITVKHDGHEFISFGDSLIHHPSCECKKTTGDSPRPMAGQTNCDTGESRG